MARQEQDCRQLCARLSWDVVEPLDCRRDHAIGIVGTAVAAIIGSDRRRPPPSGGCCSSDRAHVKPRKRSATNTIICAFRVPDAEPSLASFLHALEVASLGGVISDQGLNARWSGPWMPSVLLQRTRRSSCSTRLATRFYGRWLTRAFGTRALPCEVGSASARVAIVIATSFPSVSSIVRCNPSSVMRPSRGCHSRSG